MTHRNEGILAGTISLIEQSLHLDNGLKTKSAARALHEPPAGFDGCGIVSDLYGRIERNWDRSPGRSSQLWRWLPQPTIAPRNTSPEKTLEKAIVMADPQWVNQIPAASGLLAGVEERGVSVDLGHRCGPRHYELVELKAGEHADTPLWAAFEILRYGLLYCFARTHRDALRLPNAEALLSAGRVDLKVLAPASVYAGYSLAWLEQALDFGLRIFTAGKFSSTLEMTFCFESFPAAFHWPGMQPAELRSMLDARNHHAFVE